MISRALPDQIETRTVVVGDSLLWYIRVRVITVDGVTRRRPTTTSGQTVRNMFDLFDDGDSAYAKPWHHPGGTLDVDEKEWMASGLVLLKRQP